MKINKCQNMTRANSQPRSRKANAFGKRGNRLWQITGSHYGKQISWRVIAANEDEATAQAHARRITVATCRIAKPTRAAFAGRQTRSAP